MEYVVSEYFFRNMLQLMPFGVYFVRILNKILLFSYRNKDFVDVRLLGCFVGSFPQEIFVKMVQFDAFCCIF